MSAIYPGEAMTFEERLRAVRHRLMLIQAAVVADESEMSVEPDAVSEAVFTATIEALELLEPLREHLGELPGGMSEWVAPVAAKKRGA